MRKKFAVFSVMLFLCCVLFLISPSALELSAVTDKIPDYAKRYCATEMSCTNGVLTPATGYMTFMVQDSDSSVTLGMRNNASAGSCNAFRLVIANGTSCDRIEVRWVYRGSPETYSEIIPVSVGMAVQTRYLYIDHAEAVASLTICFPGARSGTVRLYSISPASVYRTLTEEYGTLNSCSCDLSAGVMTISGRVYSRVSAQYTGAQLCLYRLSVGEDIFDLMADSSREPIARTKMSTRFGFSVDAQNVSDRLSEYAVTVLTSGGVEFPLTEPIGITEYVGVPVLNESVDFPYFGLSGGTAAEVIVSGAEMVLLPVDLAAYFGKEVSGYTFSIGGVTYSVDRAKINRLDETVRSYTAAGCRVILRLVISGSCTDLPFVTPNVTTAQYKGVFIESEEARTAWFAAVDYLLARYSASGMRIDGIAIGYGADAISKYANCGGISLERCLKSYKEAVRLVRVAALREGTDVTVMIPVSDEIPVELVRDVENGYHKDLFLNGICSITEKLKIKNWRILLDSEHVPLLREGEEAPFYTEGGYYTAANISLFEQRLINAGIGEEYLLYLSFPEQLPEEELSLSVLYSYRALSGRLLADGVILAPGAGQESQLFPMLRELFHGKKGEAEKQALKLLGTDSWKKQFPGYVVPECRHEFPADRGIVAEQAEGVYRFWDFSTALGTLGWHADPGVLSLALNSLGTERVLCGSFSGTGTRGIYYTFSEQEDLSVYENLCFRFSVDAQEDCVFQIEVLLIGDGFTVYGGTESKGGQTTEYAMQVSDLPGKIKAIRLQLCGDQEEPFELHLFSVSATSGTLDSVALKDRVLRARELSRAEGAEKPFAEILKRTAILVLIVILSGVFVLTFWRAQKGTRGEEKTEKNLAAGRKS